MDAEAPSELLSRRHQMFPLLGDVDIARMQRFGALLAAESGTRLFSAGQAAPGMYVVLAGAVEISQRDGLGTVTPIVRGGRGHFIGEVGALSGMASLVDAVALAIEAHVEAVVRQALGVHALADASLVEQVDADLLQHTGADAREHVVAAALLEDDVVDARLVQQGAQDQARGSGADDRDLGTHGLSPCVLMDRKTRA